MPGEGSGLRPGAACKAECVLRHQPVPPPGARTGRLDQAATPDVLLETVALGAHEDSQLVEFGREPEDGDPAWRQQQELVAHGANPGAAAGTVQRVVESVRLGQHQPKNRS